MTNLNRFTLLLLGLILAASATLNASEDAVHANQQNTMQASYGQWKKVGEGTLAVLFWDVYRAELYNPSGRYQGLEGPLKLSLHYLRNIDRDDLLKRTEDEWRKLGLWDELTDIWLVQAATVFPNISKHDHLAFQLNQDNSAQLTYNGELLHRFEANEVNARFLAIWLSPNSSFPSFTQRLTGTKL